MRRFQAALILSVLVTVLPAQAQTQYQQFILYGHDISGFLNIGYDINPNTGVLGTSPNTVDPKNSWIVTHIDGGFSDGRLGIFNMPITGYVPSNPAAPDSTNLLAPASFGFFPIVNGPLRPDGTRSPGFSYDNLYYRSDSPQVASNYPLHGGYFDIYGMVFKLSDGKYVNLWSNGNTGSPDGRIFYGVGVTDGHTVLDYVTINIAPVPEPATWAMMLAGLGLAGVVLRRRGATVRLA